MYIWVVKRLGTLVGVIHLVHGMRFSGEEGKYADLVEKVEVEVEVETNLCLGFPQQSPPTR